MKRKNWIFLAALLALVLLVSVGTVSAVASGVNDYDGGDRMLVSSDPSLTIWNETDGDLLAAVLYLQVNGEVDGSIRAVGTTLQLNSNVARNVTVAGMTVSCGEAFSAGEVYIAGNQVEFLGTCETLHITGSQVIIGGTVHGEVICEAEEVIFTEDASFEQATVTASAEPVVMKRGAVNTKDYTALQDSPFADRVVFHKTQSSVVGELQSLLFSLMAAVLTALVLTFLFGKAANRISLRLNARPVPFCLKGLGMLIGLPVACLFFLMLVVTLPISAVVVLLYIAVVILSSAIAALVLGRLWLAKWSPYLSSCVLVAGITVLEALPFIGGLVSFACMIVAFGSLASVLFNRKQDDSAMQQPLDPNGGMDFQV